MDELTDKAKRFAKRHYRTTGQPLDYTALVDFARSVLPEWTLVSERLPEESGLYQVSTTGTTHEIGTRVPYVTDEHFDVDSKRFSDGYVYAWRNCPAPAQPKEGEHGI